MDLGPSSLQPPTGTRTDSTPTDARARTLRATRFKVESMMPAFPGIAPCFLLYFKILAPSSKMIKAKTGQGAGFVQKN